MRANASQHEVGEYLDEHGATLYSICHLAVLLSPDAQQRLRESVRNALPIEGATDSMLAVALGEVSRLPADLDPATRVSFGLQPRSLLSFAAGVGNADIVLALIERGLKPDAAALKAAVSAGRLDVARLLIAQGVAVDKSVVCALRVNTPEMIDLVQESMPITKWPVDDEAFVSIWRRTPDLADILGFVRMLDERSAPLNATFVYHLLRAREQDASDALLQLLDAVDIDWNAKIQVEYSGEPRTLSELALKELTLAVAEAFVERDLLQAGHIEEHWPDAADKAALLERNKLSAAEPSAAEYLAMSGAAIRAERLGVLAGADASLAGLSLGSTDEEVRAVPLRLKGAHAMAESQNAELYEEHSATHKLSVSLKKRKVRALEYAATFRAGNDQPAQLTSAIKELWSAALGKPKGRKKLVWTTDESIVTVNTQSFSGDDYGSPATQVWSIMITQP